jgi:molybdenum cofactor cytidylyltransferase
VHACGTVILAAGGSARLGRPKQLLPFGGGTLLSRAARCALDAGCGPLVVVLGADAARMSAELPEGAEVVVNERWRCGIGTSIRAGVTALERRREPPDGALLMLCDQPLLEPADLAGLVRAWSESGAPAVASGYAGDIGTPAVFGRILFPELRALHDEKGGKAVLRRHRGEVLAVPMEPARLDVDTERAYMELLSHAACRTRPEAE